MRVRSALLPTALLLASAPLAAETPMTGAEFEAYATGRTLTYAQGGTVYGTEEYLPGRRVRWAFSGDQCETGYWYEAGREICFVYGSEPEHQCWTFFRTPGGLRARFRGDPPGSELSEVANSDAPLLCPGPDIGV
jgi:hypothetical protein